MERGNAVMERGNHLMGEVRLALDRNSDIVRENLDAHRDLRRFIEEILLRSQRSHERVIDELTEMRQETRANTQVIREQSRWIQAQTKAILDVLDRLPPNGAAGQAA
jgi:hypothetical protein